MNQKARQESKNLIESNFCQFRNNANFGYDCRNNLDNCTFEPIRDEIGEINYIRKYHNSIFDSEVSKFVNSQTLKEEITAKYNNKMGKLSHDDPFYSARARSIENARAAEKKALKSFQAKEKRDKKRTVFKNYEDRINEANVSEKIKTLIYFSHQDTASIKALGAKKNETVKITTRFIKGKMLMLMISLKAFVYDLIDIFCFPDEEVKEIYARNDISKCFIYLILTDTDSCSIQFNDLKSQITEDKARDIIFDIIILKLGQRIDTSHELLKDLSVETRP